MLASISSSSEQQLVSQSHPQSSFPLHQTAPAQFNYNQQPKRLKHAESMAHRRIQRGRPSVRHGNGANYGAPKAWQCGWDNHGQGPVCTKSFGRKSDLQRHHHTHTGTRNHACTFEGCGKTFIQTSALTVHMRTHTGEKPHECSVCSKRFSDSSSLARHRKIHSNERPYPCDVEFCDKSFCRKSTLHKHIERDHPHLAVARADEDGWYDEATISPVHGEEGQAQTDLPWGVAADVFGSPFTTLPSQNFGPGRQQPTQPQQQPPPPQQQQQQQVTRSPFTSVRQRGTPDPTYRNYPHPSLSVGQVQNLSGADIRGFHPNAMVNPPNIQQARDHPNSRVGIWNEQHGLVVSTMGMIPQRTITDGYNEYAPRSAPVDNYASGIMYNGQPMQARHEHRRSASDAGATIIPMQQKDYAMQQRHSVDTVHVDQHQQHDSQTQQAQQDAQNLAIVDENSYVEGNVDYSQQQTQQEQNSTQQSYPSIEAPAYEHDSYQEPQDLGIMAGQTYAIPMAYDFGISAIGFDDDKYLDTFGDPLPSQLLQ